MTTTMLCMQEDLIDKHHKLRNAIENLSSKYQKDVGGLTYICAQEAKKCGFEVSLPRLISHIKRSSTRQQRFRWDVAIKRGGMSRTTQENVHVCAGNCFPRCSTRDLTWKSVSRMFFPVRYWRCKPTAPTHSRCWRTNTCAPSTTRPSPSGSTSTTTTPFSPHGLSKPTWTW